MNYGMDYAADTGGDSGGGFGGSSQYGGGTPGSTGGGGRRNYDEQTVIPVTVRMALAAQQDPNGSGGEKLEDGRSLHHVRIVGAVRSCEDNSTNIVYNIEDGTGLIDVKQWSDDSDCAALLELRQQTAKDNIYVKVVGQVKDYDGKKMIVASSVRPLTTGNELTHHMLEVVYSSERHQKKDRIMPMAPSVISSGGVGFGPSTVQSMGGAGVSDGSDDSYRAQILSYIKHEGALSETGANIKNIVQMLNGRQSEFEIREAIDQLSAEGHIYSTVNEDNFKFAM